MRGAVGTSGLVLQREVSLLVRGHENKIEVW